jgi:hypothetical protein
MELKPKVDYGDVSMNVRIDPQSAELVKTIAYGEGRKAAPMIRIFIQEGLERRLKELGK